MLSFQLLCTCAIRQQVESGQLSAHCHTEELSIQQEADFLQAFTYAILAQPSSYTLLHMLK